MCIRDRPNSAENLEVRQFSRRVETFVTAGAPTREVLKPSGKGLELFGHVSGTGSISDTTIYGNVDVG